MNPTVTTIVETYHPRRFDHHDTRRLIWDGTAILWRFSDGIDIYYRSNPEWRQAERASRVYVYSTGPFNVLEDLMNRYRRPAHLWRPVTHEAMARIGIVGRLTWSQKAGCSCGCSPGFISNAVRGGDFSIRVPDLTMIDDLLPPRTPM